MPGMLGLSLSFILNQNNHNTDYTKQPINKVNLIYSYKINAVTLITTLQAD